MDCLTLAQGIALAAAVTGALSLLIAVLNAARQRREARKTFPVPIARRMYGVTSGRLYRFALKEESERYALAWIARVKPRSARLARVVEGVADMYGDYESWPGDWSPRVRLDPGTAAVRLFVDFGKSDEVLLRAKTILRSDTKLRASVIIRISLTD